MKSSLFPFRVCQSISFLFEAKKGAEQLLKTDNTFVLPEIETERARAWAQRPETNCTKLGLNKPLARGSTSRLKKLLVGLSLDNSSGYKKYTLP